MSSAAKKTYITPEEYLALERAAQYKSEYRDGEIFAMSGASRPHNLIVANFARRIGERLDDRDCELYIADMKVHVQRTGSYSYPDLVVVCGEPRLGDRHADVLLNPVAIVEILSPSTEKYDRGVKFADYRAIESLIDYVLVSQDKILIESHSRLGDDWVASVLDRGDQILRLSSIGCELTVRDLYAKVPTA